MVLAMLFIPAVAMGFQQVSDKELSDVTGKEGVSIAIDDVKLYQNSV